MRYGSVCSGIEAATAAWHHLGWEPAFFSEIEAFPRAVLEHHYPEVPLHGDFTTIEENQYGKIDLLVGGTPCQSFSIAGLRGGLDDERGNLALEFCRLAQRERPRWIVWENVPGVLSSNGGRDFGSILGALAQLGYGIAYRVLDAQYFGVAQRRRRVFVVGYLGDWRHAAAVLFERHSMSGHPAPSREARKEAARSALSGAEKRGGRGGGGLAVKWPADVACTLFVPNVIAYRTTGNDGAYETGEIVGALDTQTDPNARIVAFTAKDYGADAMEDCSPTLRAGGFADSHQNGGVMPAVASAIQERAVSENLENGPQGKGSQEGVAYTLEARNTVQATAFALRGREGGAMPEVEGDQVGALRAANGGSSRSYIAATAVRRLTPVECERLQGFPDNFTAIPWRGKPADQCPDGPRYKALGNSMAVPVMRWIGERIRMAEDMTSVL